MSVRAIIFGFTLATSEAIRGIFTTDSPKAVIHVLEDVQIPPYCYIKIDEQVFALKL